MPCRLSNPLSVSRYFWLILYLLAGLTLIGCERNKTEIKHVGILQFTSVLDTVVEDMKTSLEELGYEEGRNITYQYRNAQGDMGLLPRYIQELIDAEVDAVVAITTPAAVVAHGRAGKIPVIFSLVSDPIAAGLVTDLTQPGGNITGIRDVGTVFAPKRLELLHEIDAGILKVLLVHSDTPGHQAGIEELRRAALTLGMTLETVQINTPEEASIAFDAISPGAIDAVLIPSDAVVIGAQDALTRLLQRDHIPSIGDDGMKSAVITYGPPLAIYGPRTAVMVAKVLRGIAPGSLPVEMPGQGQLTLFLATAKQIGYSFPEEAFSLADTVVQ